MEILAGFAVLLLCATCLVVGVKLLLLARRTGGVPELFLGLYFFLSGAFGYPLSATSAASWEGARLAAIVSPAFTGLASVFLVSFTAHVFRPQSRIAWMLAGATAALSAVHVVGSGHAHFHASTPAEVEQAILQWGALTLVVNAICWGWTAWETLRHYTNLRRRLRVGLADPVVTNRMFLWGLMSSTIAAVVCIDGFLLYVIGTEWARTVLVPLVTATAGTLSCLSLLLAFLPPRAYRSLLERRAARAQS
ncbi:MAG: hypothetical protein MJE66_09995 [Proteobacteria bacterium]|nr:hypothetical protein [Pseudomonadota bacterium]